MTAAITPAGTPAGTQARSPAPFPAPAPHDIGRALDLLRAEAGRTSIAAAARRIGYSRPAVSMVLAGTYPGRMDRVAVRVLARLDTVACPADGTVLTAAACREIHGRPMPTSSPRALRRWRECRGCPAAPGGPAAPVEGPARAPACGGGDAEP